MGEALLGGVIERGWCRPEELAVVEVDEERRNELSAAHPGVAVVDSPLAEVDAIVAVKPHHVPEVAATLARLGVARILSIAAGVTIATIESQAYRASVVRGMPNTPALVGQGASAIAAGTRASTADLDWAAEILGSVGVVMRLEEPALDAVTGLSGSGPAYVFRLAEGLTAAGVAQGLDPETADALTRQTLLGAATLLAQSDDDPATLRENVTSPGGTTAAGLEVFADADFLGLVDRVVAAAAARSRELGVAEAGS